MLRLSRTTATRSPGNLATWLFHNNSSSSNSRGDGKTLSSWRKTYGRLSLSTSTVSLMKPRLDGHVELKSQVRGIMEDVLKIYQQWNLSLKVPGYQQVRESLGDLDRSLRISVLGEFNVGKSTLINLLLKRSLMKEAPTVETNRIYQIRYGETLNESNEEDPIPATVIQAPVDWLRDYDAEIVDTPGIGSIFRDNEDMTLKFVHRSDIVLFISDCNRQFIEESEQVLLRSLTQRHVLFVLNQIDHLANENDDLNLILKKIMPQLSLYSKNPLVIPISARKAKLALRAKEERNLQSFEVLRKESRLDNLERIVFSELSSENRLNHKLGSSLANARDAIHELSMETDKQIRILSEKCKLLRNVVEAIEEYKRVLMDNFEKMELTTIDDLMIQTNKNLKKVFQDFGVVRLVYDSSSLEGYLREAFNETQFKETENRMSYVMGKLNETGERIREVVMSSLQQILADPHMDQHEITRSALEDAKVLIETAASMQHQAESDPFKLANTLLRLQIHFDEISKCHDVKTKGRRALVQTLGMEMSAIGVQSIFHFFKLSVLMGTASGGSLIIAGIWWLKYRWNKIQEELLNRTAEFHMKLKSTLLTTFERELKQRKIIPLSAILETCEKIFHSKLDILNENSTRLRALTEDIENLHQHLNQQVLPTPTDLTQRPSSMTN